jgi:hypothetical protein
MSQMTIREGIAANRRRQEVVWLILSMAETF